MPAGIPAAWSYRTFDPTLISRRFEDVITQKEPARPVYGRQSFVTWSCLFRLFFSDADTEAAPLPSVRIRATRPAITTSGRRWAFMNTPLADAG
jgi:hypothetical protein